jgi:uncharacterized protein (DUF1499 family)
MNGKVTMFLLLGSLLSTCSGTNPSSLGVRDSRLTPCPDRPNCVSSQSADNTHAIAPLTYESAAGNAIDDLKMDVGSMRGASIVEESPNYLHVVFRSDLFRFVDDVEFALDDVAKLIHVRSASRIGYYDFGTNRRRVEKIRKTRNQGQTGY